MLNARAYRQTLLIAGALLIIFLALNLYYYTDSSTYVPHVQVLLPNASALSTSNEVNASVFNASIISSNTRMSFSTVELGEMNDKILRGIARPVWNDASEKVAIIVPFRDRTKHLFNFLSHMLPFLSKQRRQYVIIVTDQAGDQPFNRAKLCNVAVTEIRNSVPGDRFYGIECFIFHDVDKVPASLCALYECGQNVRELVTAFRFRSRTQRLYGSFLGGVTAFHWAHVKKINGASNLFTGWGGEDDEMLLRLKLNNIKVDRVRGPNVVFDEFDANHRRDKNAARFKLLAKNKVLARWRNDGLNQTHYKLLGRINYDLFVWLLVSI